SGKQEGAGEVDPDRGVPTLRGVVADGCAVADAVVADERVDTAERVNRARGRPIRTVGRADVGWDDHRAAARGRDLLGHLGERLGPPAHERDCVAALREAQRGLSPDPASLPGADRRSRVTLHVCLTTTLQY